jgi:hypothetical protein
MVTIAMICFNTNNFVYVMLMLWPSEGTSQLHPSTQTDTGRHTELLFHGLGRLGCFTSILITETNEENVNQPVL